MLTGTMISEICNAITLADTAQKIGKGISKWSIISIGLGNH